MTIRILAYAKLNLALGVLGKRADGLHEIHSIVQTVDLADRLTLSEAKTIHVSCDVPIEGTNLAERAARLLLDRKRSQAGIDIRIEKHIPLGAGLGGGSSDAAAVLAAVNRWIPPLVSHAEMLEIAASIGADVPLFLTGGCLAVRGIGTPERALALRPETFVILVPPVHCDTGEIYRAWNGSAPRTAPPELGQNDLYEAAATVHPVLAQYKSTVSALGGVFAGMSGSGSAFFSAFAHRDEAIAAAERLAGREPDCRVYYCQSTTTGYAERGGTA